MPTHHVTKQRWTTLLTLLAVQLLPVSSYPIDRKFELDTTALGKRIAQAPAHSARTSKKEFAAFRKAMKPHKPRKWARAVKKRAKHPRAAAGATSMMQFALAAPSAANRKVTGQRWGGAGTRRIEDVKRLWPQLVQYNSSDIKEQFDYISNTYALSLDSDRYPTLPAYDGHTILIDRMGTLPPAVSSLIKDSNPQLRIVSGNPADSRGFYRALLTAAQFYSLEEDFSVTLGADPRITVQADFRIEKDADSVLQQSIMLVNVPGNRRAMPDGLVRLLAESGFQVLEEGYQGRQAPGGRSDLMFQVTRKEPKQIVDSLLGALSLRVETGKRISLYDTDLIGVRLAVPVDRYFEANGLRYVVRFFDGDPASYTLTQLLEAKGYQIITIKDDDTFQSITDKLLSRLQIPGHYAEQELWPVSKVGYGVRMSGVMIKDPRNGGRNLFLTDRDVNPLVRELTSLNGYRLQADR